MDSALIDRENRIARLEAARKELEDAFFVMTHLETKQSNVVQSLAATQEGLAATQEELAAQQEELAAKQAARKAEMEELERRHALRMLEFDEKLNALIDIVGRGEPLRIRLHNS